MTVYASARQALLASVFVGACVVGAVAQQASPTPATSPPAAAAPAATPAPAPAPQAAAAPPSAPLQAQPQQAPIFPLAQPQAQPQQAGGLFEQMPAEQGICAAQAC